MADKGTHWFAWMHYFTGTAIEWKLISAANAKWRVKWKRWKWLSFKPIRGRKGRKQWKWRGKSNGQFKRLPWLFGWSRRSKKLRVIRGRKQIAFELRWLWKWKEFE